MENRNDTQGKRSDRGQSTDREDTYFAQDAHPLDLEERALPSVPPPPFQLAADDASKRSPLQKQARSGSAAQGHRPRTRRPDFTFRVQGDRVMVYLRSVLIGTIVGGDPAGLFVQGNISGEPGNWNATLELRLPFGQYFQPRSEVPFFVSRLWDIGVAQLDITARSFDLEGYIMPYSISVPDERPLPRPVEAQVESPAPAPTLVPEPEPEGHDSAADGQEQEVLPLDLVAAIEAIEELAQQSQLADSAMADSIYALIRNLDLRNPTYLIPLATLIARSFPSPVLARVMEYVEHPSSYGRTQEELDQMESTLDLMRVSPRGAYGTYTALPMTEMLTPDAIGVVNQGVHSLGSFWQGMRGSLEQAQNPQVVDALFSNLRQSAIINLIAPPIFGAGAVVGIGRSFWQAIEGLWELITNFPEMVEMLEAMTQMFLTGDAIPYAFGQLMGAHLSQEIIQMAEYNPVRFTFELGKLAGPAIAMAVMAFIGVTPLSMLGGAVSGILRIIQNSGRLSRMARRIQRFLRGRDRSPISEMSDEELEQVLEALERTDGPHRDRSPDDVSPEDDAEFPDLTDEEIGQALDESTTPAVTGGRSNPRMDGIRVRDTPFDRTPHDGSSRNAPQRGHTNRADIQDIERQIIRHEDGTETVETMRQALMRVRVVIGQKISDIPLLAACWERARGETLWRHGRLKQELMDDQYEYARGRFWIQVYRDPAAMEFLLEHGFRIDRRGNAAHIRLTDPNVSAQESLISLDHILEKSIGENWQFALDANNLRFEPQNPNSFREALQVAFDMVRATSSD